MAFISTGLPLRRVSRYPSTPSTLRLSSLRCVASPPDDTKDTKELTKAVIRAARIVTPPDSHASKRQPESKQPATPPPTPSPLPPPAPTPPPAGPPGGEWASTVAGFSAAIGLVVLLSTVTGGGLENESGESILQLVNDFIFGPRFLISLGMGLSAFIQALTGFGFAIVSVATITQLDWVVHSSVFDVIQPVAATLGAATGWALLLPEIRKVKWSNITTLLAASTLATPLGVAIVELVDAQYILRSLGALITGYVAFALAGLEVPEKLSGEPGAWLFGSLAGALGGAFDITGPPLVIFGEARKWTDGDFRRNVLAVVSINSSVVVLYDAFVGRLNDFYYWDFVKFATPSVIIGILVGNWLSKKLDSSAFKKIVLGTCMALGVKLLVS